MPNLPLISPAAQDLMNRSRRHIVEGFSLDNERLSSEQGTAANYNGFTTIELFPKNADDVAEGLKAGK
jgi:hypothetical protein